MTVHAGEQKGTLILCWWECKLVKPVWNLLWWFIRKMGIDLLQDGAIPTTLEVYKMNVSYSRLLLIWWGIMGKETWGGKGALTYTSVPLLIIYGNHTGTQCRSDAEAMGGGGCLLMGLLHIACWVCFLREPKTLAQGWNHLQWSGPSHQSIITKIS